MLFELDTTSEHFQDLFRMEWGFRLRRIGLHPFKVIFRKLQNKFFKDKPLVVKAKTFFGSCMYIHSFEHSLWFSGFLAGSEVKLQKFIIRNFNSEGVFFDIGAHHGFYTLLSNRLIGNNEGKVHSFEPTDTHFSILKKNVVAKKNIFANKIALCDTKGKKMFYENIRGKSTIEKDFFKNVGNSNPRDFRSIEVVCTTLDDYCYKNNVKPTFIKIDVEGGEYQVLRGGKKILNGCNPVIAMEVWGEPYDNRNHVRAMNFLLKNKYKPFKLNLDGTIKLLDVALDESFLKNLGSDNLIFIK